jgi:flagellar protein FliL
VAKEDEGAAGAAAVPAAAAAAAAPEPKSRFSRRLMLIVIVLMILILAGGGGYYYFFMMKKKDEVKGEEPPPPPKTYVFYNLPGFVVNLPASAGRTSFLKITVSLELDSAADVRIIQSVMPRLVDRMQAYLRELRPDDLKGTAGVARLHQELLERARTAAPEAKVNDVLLQELLLQ